MEYIVALDMEWNQPLPWKQYPQVPKALLPGEIIQIGAVKSNPAGRIVDELRISVRPKYFRQVHWKVKKLTHLNEEEMMKGIAFPEAIAQLGQWLNTTGPNFNIFTWGSEDERVLISNLDAWGLNPSWLPETVYDVRFIYDSFLSRSDISTSLTDAASELGAELNLDQHDSLNDARYLAAICARIDLPRGIKEYEELGPAPAPGKPLQRLSLKGFRDTSELLKAPNLREFSCPCCGQSLTVQDWVPQNKDRQISITICPQGHKSFLRIHWKLRPDRSYTVIRTVYQADRDAEDYYKKRLQRFLSAQKHTRKAKGNPDSKALTGAKPASDED